ncbi:PaaD-like zinc ribbon domain-containing protein [Alteribacillus persepolensis]
MSVKSQAVCCSFCSSEDVTKISSFGTAQLVRQYYCNHCRSVFEYIRWQ